MSNSYFYHPCFYHMENNSYNLHCINLPLFWLLEVVYMSHLFFHLQSCNEVLQMGTQSCLGSLQQRRPLGERLMCHDLVDPLHKQLDIIQDCCIDRIDPLQLVPLYIVSVFEQFYHPVVH
eukprot:NODE_1044_length_2480_cov_0.378412.p2 type:complete len:120 gc:universal NODE_1044_length_2480_cov_0.378412:507-866(+)